MSNEFFENGGLLIPEGPWWALLPSLAVLGIILVVIWWWQRRK
ncbi:MAG: hypothetical protein AAFY43_01690 [Pseudomonadota bacterium]